MARPKPTIQLGMTVDYHSPDGKTVSAEVIGAIPRLRAYVSYCTPTRYERTGEYELTLRLDESTIVDSVLPWPRPTVGHWSFPAPSELEPEPARTTVATVKVGIEYDEAQLDGLIAKLKTVNALQDRLTAAGGNVGVFRERLRGVALSADVAESLIQIIRSRII